MNVGPNGFFDMIAGATATVDALTGNGLVSSSYGYNNWQGPSILTIGVAGGSGTFSGTISDTTPATADIYDYGDAFPGYVGIDKVGGGIEVLTGANTYGGGTTVSGGTLVMNGSNTGGGPVNVNGATLVVNGSFVGNGAVTVTGGVLVVNGSMSPISLVTNSAGTLSGTGTVGNVVDSNGAVIQPGNGAAGTLTFGGLALTSGDTVAMVLNTPNVAPGTGGNSLMQINGPLSLDTGITVAVTSIASLANGIYYLATFGSVADNSYDFSGWSPTGASGTFVLAGRTLDLVVGPWVLSGSGGTWTGPGSGSWATAGSWSGNFVPGVEGDTALFGGSIAAAATVTLDSDRTLSGLTFDNSSYSYTIAGVNSLTLANSGLPVPVTVANGSHTIAVPVVLADDATSRRPSDPDHFRPDQQPRDEDSDPVRPRLVGPRQRQQHFHRRRSDPRRHAPVERF